MKVCFIEERYSHPQTTGPSKHIRELGRALISRGHDVVVVCMKVENQNPLVQAKDPNDDTDPKVVGLTTLRFAGQRFMIGLERHIQAMGADIVHCQGYRSVTTDRAALVSKINRIPFVLSPRGSIRGSFHREISSLTPIAARLYDSLSQRHTLRTSDAIVVTSESEKRDALSMGIGSQHIRLIPHGMVFPREPAQAANLKGSPRLLTVGRITPRRNITDIVRSMNLVLNEFPEAVLYVVGDPIPDSHDAAEAKYPRELARLANEGNFRDHVRVLGGVYDDRLWALYSGSDVYVYASSYDNFAFTLLEAAHFGLPIVSTEVGIARKLIGDGEGGILLLNHRPESIANGVIEVLKNMRFYKGARDHLIQMAGNYSIDRNCDAHIQLYEDLIANQ